MQVYVEVSKNHRYNLVDVMKGQYIPEIRLLIMYYNNKFRLEEKEYKKMEKEIEKQKNGGE